MNGIPILMLKQVLQLLVVMLTLGTFQTEQFGWVVGEHLSPGTCPLSWATGAQHELRPIPGEN